MNGARRWLLVLLLATGAARLLVVALHDPIAGYGNQFDMARSSACLGLWPDQPLQPQDLATPAAPIAGYRYGGPGGQCYPSTDVALAAVAVMADRLLDDGDNSFDLRQLGLLKALVLIAIALALDRKLRWHPAARLGHAALFALLVADPFNALYLNTLYTEFGALAGAYLALGCLYAMSLVARANRALLAGFVLALLMLGFSRSQHVALVPLLALIALLALRARGHAWRGLAVGGAAAVVATLAFAAALQGMQSSVAAANSVNTVFGALLPASRDPAALAARLGLPADCVALNHTTWYRQRGHDVVRACPAVTHVSRPRMLAALLREPTTLAVLLARGVAISTGWRIAYVGEVAGDSYARLAAGPPDPWTSIADPLARRGFAFHVVLWLVPLFAGAFAFGSLLVTARRRGKASRAGFPEFEPQIDPLVALLAAGGGIVALTLASAVFGDGYSELARHLHLAQNAALMTWAALPVLLVRVAVRARNHTPSQSRYWARLVRTAALATVLLALGLALALTRLPLAYGVLDQPRDDGVAPSPMLLSGWAIDPSGVMEVEAHFDDGTRIGLALRDDELLSRLMPSRRGDNVVRFEGGAAARTGALSIVVRNARGVETVIDQRHFTSTSGAP